jgi:hypothetical protein
MILILKKLLDAVYTVHMDVDMGRSRDVLLGDVLYVRRNDNAPPPHLDRQ